jgi:apolipoprotein D and lipocalin family protein
VTRLDEIFTYPAAGKEQKMNRSIVDSLSTSFDPKENSKMKKFVVTLSLFFGFSSFAAAPETVASVDINRYLGTWYEIAAIPQFFQRKCVSDTKAEYEMARESELVRVINSCKTESGEIAVAEGRAKVIDKNTNAKLQVTFMKIFDWVFIPGGHYWILDLAPDYSYAIVGHPRLRYGWILSRTPNMENDTLLTLEKKIRALGYDSCKFKTTVQTGGLGESKTLCQLAQTGPAGSEFQEERF